MLAPRSADRTADGVGPAYRGVGALRHRRQLRRGGPAGPCQPGPDKPDPRPAQPCPDIQEQLLFLEHPGRGRPAPVLRQVLTVAAALDWDEQRRRWRKLQRATRQYRAAVP